MSEPDPIVAQLRRLAAFLAANDEQHWAPAFQQLADEFDQDPVGTKARVRGCFGGMGSFNDLVLHDADKYPRRDENEELERLRSDLYEMCKTR